MKRNKTLFAITLGLLVVVAVGGAQSAGKRINVIVYNLDAQGIPPSIAEIMTGAIVMKLSESPKLFVRDEKATIAFIKEKDLAQSGFTCEAEEETCRIDNAKAVKADWIILGSIGKLAEKKYVVRIRVADVNATTKYPQSQICRDCSNEQVLDLVETMAGNVRTFVETGKKPEAAATTTPIPTPGMPPTGIAPPPETPKGVGTLKISTNPSGADIYIDATPMGKTPKTLANITAGTHQLTLVKNGYTTLNKGVSVAAGRTTAVSEILVRQTGTIDVKSVPSGAQIRIDGKYVGTTPKSIPGMSVGKHTVKLTLRDYSDFEAEVNVEANDTASVNPALKGLPGKILVTSTPSGADVFIDAKKVGTTPYSGALSPGSHAVRVSKQGYQSAEQTVAIQPNKPKTLDMTLKKGPDIRGDMVRVPAGEFMMGCNSSVDNGCDGDEKPYHKVYLDEYYIDKYEVTVGQYGACVQAGKCKKPDTGEICNWGKSDRGKHPVNCVDWNQAKAYCEYAGKRLPTEAEWEKAARGTDGRVYPWGNQQASCDYAVMDDGGNGCGRKTTWPVGSKPKGASPYGAMDMAGNVWEWVADWYDKNYYNGSPNRNPTGPSSGAYRVVRGGGWSLIPRNMRASARGRNDPVGRGFRVFGGFRCAR